MMQLIDDEIPITNYISFPFIFELCVQLIFPWPHFETLCFIPQYAQSHVKTVCYFSSDLILIFMFIRLYSLIKHLERYREFMDI